MRDRIFTLLVLMILPLLFSCSKDSNNDHFIFGHSFGLCAGEECVETFKVADGQIFEDTKDQYGNKGPYEFESMDKASYEIAKNLETMIPEDLNDEDDVIGCPDCYDQGGIYIEIMKDGEKSSWWIDMDKKNLPDYLHGFKDSVAMTIQAIQ